MSLAILKHRGFFLLRWHITLQKMGTFHMHSLTLQIGGGEEKNSAFCKEVFLLCSSVDTLCWRRFLTACACSP